MENCTLGIENKTRIDNMEKTVEKFMDKMENCVTELTNHYSKRLPMWAMFSLMILSNLVIGLAVYFLTRGR